MPGVVALREAEAPRSVRDAWRAGLLRPGDAIVAVNNRGFAEPARLLRAANGIKSGGVSVSSALPTRLKRRRTLVISRPVPCGDGESDDEGEGEGEGEGARRAADLARSSGGEGEEPLRATAAEGSPGGAALTQIRVDVSLCEYALGDDNDQAAAAAGAAALGETADDGENDVGSVRIPVRRRPPGASARPSEAESDDGRNYGSHGRREGSVRIQVQTGTAPSAATAASAATGGGRHAPDGEGGAPEHAPDTPRAAEWGDGALSGVASLGAPDNGDGAQDNAASGPAAGGGSHDEPDARATSNSSSGGHGSTTGEDYTAQERANNGDGSGAPRLPRPRTTPPARPGPRK